MRALIVWVEVAKDGVDLTFRTSAAALIVGSGSRFETGIPGEGDQKIRPNVPAKLKRVGKGDALVINGPTAGDRKLGPILLRLLAKAHRYRVMLLSGDALSIQALAGREGVTRRYCSAVVWLGLLAPEIGRQRLSEPSLRCCVTGTVSG